MKKNITFLTTLISGVALLSTPLYAQNANTDPNQQPVKLKGGLTVESNTPPDTVIISEVCYWPKEGEVEWIEVTNVSSESIDIRDWKIMDGQAINFVISTTPLIIPPRGSIVIRFDGSGKSITPFNESGMATAYSPKNIADNVLGDYGGHLALYSPASDRPNAQLIQSYVAWGYSPGYIAAEAVELRKWPNTKRVVPGTGRITVLGVGVFTQQGGSIGVIPPQDKKGTASVYWGVLSPEEVNPGRLEVMREVRISPLNTEVTDGRGYANLNLIRMEDGIKYQFQVCSDQDCKVTIIDYISDEPHYRIEKPVPRSTTYYWRARLVRPDNSVSAWSRILSLTNKQPR